MSMNLHVSGEREVTVNKTGKISKQTIYFDLWQTPTSVTKQAIRGTDAKAVYIEWAKSISRDDVEPVYAASDLFQEQEPIGTRIYNASVGHIAELEAWLTEAEAEGYEIEFFEM